MKYAQLIIGLLVGTALGGAVVLAGTSTGGSSTGGSAKLDKAAIQEIIRETIPQEGKLLMDALNNYQQDQQRERTAQATDALKDKAVQDEIYHDPEVAFAGNPDATRVVAEFFDYNCPACKMQFKALAELLEKDKNVKVVFHEYPIFGPQSDTNSKIGLGVFNVAPNKYFAFHDKMMANEGRTDEATAYQYVKDLGINVDKVKAFVESPKAQAGIDKSRQIGSRMGIQGTPSVFIGAEMIPHAVSYQEIEQRLGQ